VQEHGLWREDGFRSVREWLKHVGRLSGSEAWGYATVAATAERRLGAGCGDLDGAELNEILTRSVETETLADWEQARAERGAAVAPRTSRGPPRNGVSMRSWPIFRAAAGSPPDGVDPDPVVCVVVDEQPWPTSCSAPSGPHHQPTARSSTTGRCAAKPSTVIP
jgi:hypothetical protein